MVLLSVVVVVVDDGDGDDNDDNDGDDDDDDDDDHHHHHHNDNDECGLVMQNSYECSITHSGRNNVFRSDTHSALIRTGQIFFLIF